MWIIKHIVWFLFVYYSIICTAKPSFMCSSGSDEERKAARRAFRHSSRREHQVYDVSPPDVTFDLDTPEEVKLGDDFTVTMWQSVGSCALRLFVFLTTSSVIIYFSTTFHELFPTMLSNNLYDYVRLH